MVCQVSDVGFFFWVVLTEIQDMFSNLLWCFIYLNSYSALFLTLNLVAKGFRKRSYANETEQNVHYGKKNVTWAVYRIFCKHNHYPILIFLLNFQLTKLWCCLLIVFSTSVINNNWCLYLLPRRSKVIKKYESVSGVEWQKKCIIMKDILNRFGLLVF